MKTPISMIPSGGVGVAAVIAAALIIGIAVYAKQQNSTASSVKRR